MCVAAGVAGDWQRDVRVGSPAACWRVGPWVVPVWVCDKCVVGVELCEIEAVDRLTTWVGWDGDAGCTPANPFR